MRWQGLPRRAPAGQGVWSFSFSSGWYLRSKIRKKRIIKTKIRIFASQKHNNLSQNTSSYQLRDINPRIFWDSDLSVLDYEKNAPLIIQRVLEYGDLSDWYAIKKHYGLDRIVSISKNLRSLDAVAVTWLCCLSNARMEDFRCYRIAQSSPTPWNS